MTTEFTIRLADPRADINAMIEGLITTFDVALNVKGRVIGGFYFETERSPAEFFTWMSEEGFTMSDFENIVIKAA